MLAKDRESTILYMFNEDKTILYFSGLNKDFSLLGINTSNIKHLINSDSLYLGKYVLTSSMIPGADISGMSASDLVEQLDKDKTVSSTPTGKGIGVALFNKSNNKTSTFRSLSACAKYLTSIGLKTTGHTLKSRLVSGEEFEGYLVKWDLDQNYVHHKANSVSITNVETGEVILYDSLRDAERITGI